MILKKKSLIPDLKNFTINFGPHLIYILIIFLVFLVFFLIQFILHDHRIISEQAGKIAELGRQVAECQQQINTLAQNTIVDTSSSNILPQDDNKYIIYIAAGGVVVVTAAVLIVWIFPGVFHFGAGVIKSAVSATTGIIFTSTDTVSTCTDIVVYTPRDIVSTSTDIISRGLLSATSEAAIKTAEVATQTAACSVVTSNCANALVISENRCSVWDASIGEYVTVLTKADGELGVGVYFDCSAVTLQNSHFITLAEYTQKARLRASWELLNTMTSSTESFDAAYQAVQAGEAAETIFKILMGIS